jgi:hypothetical protein
MLYDSPIALIDKTPIAPTAANERCCKICTHPFKAAKSKVVGRCQNAKIITEIDTQMKPYRLIENTIRRIRFQRVVTDVRTHMVQLTKVSICQDFFLTLCKLGRFLQEDTLAGTVLVLVYQELTYKIPFIQGCIVQ